MRGVDTYSPLAHTLRMNFTIFIEDEVAERARERASAMGLTVEQAVEDFVRELASDPKRAEGLPKRRTLREEIYRLG